MGGAVFLTGKGSDDRGYLTSAISVVGQGAISMGAGAGQRRLLYQSKDYEAFAFALRLPFTGLVAIALRPRPIDLAKAERASA